MTGLVLAVSGVILGCGMRRGRKGEKGYRFQ